MIKNFSDHSANERTFLAWIRTSLALLAGGIALRAVVEPFGVRGVRTTLAVTAVALSLAACGGSDDDSDTTSGGTGAASPGGGAEGASITLMVGVKGDPFYVSMECGATEAADAAGATLEVQGPDKFDATLQNPMLDAVAAQQPDALLVAPNDVTASAPPLKRIQDAGTTVVLVDTIVTDETIGVSRIATDNNLGGQKAAEALDQLGVTGKVLVISTDPGVSSVDARVELQHQSGGARTHPGRRDPVLAQQREHGSAGHLGGPGQGS